MGVCNFSLFCCTLLYVHSSIAIILMGKRELIALLNLSSWCLVMVERLFLAVQRGCLQFVIVVFPDHTHLLFLISLREKKRYLNVTKQWTNAHMSAHEWTNANPKTAHMHSQRSLHCWTYLLPKTLWQSYLGDGPLVWPSWRWPNGGFFGLYPLLTKLVL